MEQNTENPTPVSPEPQQEVSQDSKNLGLLCHLLGFLTSFVGPLILWLVKKDQDAFVSHHGKEALNFQITVILAGIVAGLSILICIGIVLAPAVGLLDLIFSILACVAASKGEYYKYPFCLRLIK